MNKTFLIIRREYLARVRKKSFIIMTILGPLLFGGIFSATFLLNKVDKEEHTIVVLDKTHLFTGKFKSDDRLKFIYLDENVDSIRSKSKEMGYFGVLYIPEISDPKVLEKSVVLYSESQPGIDILGKIEHTLEKEINTSKYLAAGIDESKLAGIKTDVVVKTKDMKEKETDTGLTTGLGFAGGLLIYMFIFIYGAAVMRGVMEEKMSRIVEVIISSVKPFQLMMGKIIGVALVGLTQFLLWIVLSFVVVTVVSKNFGAKDISADKIENVAKVSSGDPQVTEAMKDQVGASPMMNRMNFFINSIDYPVILLSFIFYFLAGYLLYSALFAAIGSAVDSETDTQQFMLPVTIPLILAYIASISVIENPNGAVAFWFSIIPLTSPIVMMVRIPFGVPYWQIGLSMGLLILGFIFTTWLAAKIYRTGILMYGKKVSYRELAKWIRYRN